jgi:hypothetical protein
LRSRARKQVEYKVGDSNPPALAPRHPEGEDWPAGTAADLLARCGLVHHRRRRLLTVETPNLTS